MPSNEYGLGDLNFSRRNYKTAAGTDEIVFSVYGGSLSVAVCKAGEWKPHWRQTINPIRQRIILSRLKALISKSPGTKDPIIFSRWDGEQKKHVPEWRLEFQKDEKMMYHILVAWKGNTHDAIIRGAYGVAFGSDNLSEADASFYGIDDFCNWLGTTVPLQMVLTNKRREQNGTGNSGGSRSNENTTASDDYF